MQYRNLKAHDLTDARLACVRACLARGQERRQPHPDCSEHHASPDCRCAQLYCRDALQLLRVARVPKGRA